MLKINLVLESKIWMIASRKMGNINPVTFMLPSHRRCSFSPHHDTKKKCQSFNFPFFSCWWRAYRRSIECKQSGDDQTDDVSPLVIQSRPNSWRLQAYLRFILDIHTWGSRLSSQIGWALFALLSLILAHSTVAKWRSVDDTALIRTQGPAQTGKGTSTHVESCLFCCRGQYQHHFLRLPRPSVPPSPGLDPLTGFL